MVWRVGGGWDGWGECREAVSTGVPEISGHIMKPIVVIDADAFDWLEEFPEEMSPKALACIKATQLKTEGYLVLPVKPGARVEVLGMPPDVGKGVEARVPILPMANRVPILIADADSGLGEEALEDLRALGYSAYLVTPGSRVQVL